MIAPLTAPEWLAAGATGTGVTVLALVLIRAALDAGRPPDHQPKRRQPGAPPLPECRPPRRARHAAPLDLAETQPLVRVHTRHGRHSKDTPWT
ncbi:hypothetical protein [Streptomyces sp. NPDC001091]